MSAVSSINREIRVFNEDGAQWTARNGDNQVPSIGQARAPPRSGRFGLAACGGPSSPHVANLGANAATIGGSATTTLPAGSATRLLDEWASCMRSHSDPDQVDPTVDANKVIQLTLPVGYTDGLGALLNGEVAARAPLI